MIFDPTRTVEIVIDNYRPEYRLVSKKFNVKWLWNPFWIIICILSAVTISYFGYKYGGKLALITSMYPAFELGRIATFFIIDVEHEFWNKKYELVE